MKAYFARLSPRAFINSYIKLVFTYHISCNASKTEEERGDRLEGQSCVWALKATASCSPSLKPNFLWKLCFFQGCVCANARLSPFSLVFSQLAYFGLI